MYVLLGTDRPVESYRTEVDPGLSAKHLKALAVEAGVEVGDNPGRDLLAARLESVTRKRDIAGPSVVTVNFPDGMPLMECANTITLPQGIWDSHSPGAFADSGSPLWVESDSPALQALLAEHYGCAAGAPASLENDYYTENGPPSTGPKKSSGKSPPTVPPLLLLMWLFLLLTPRLRGAPGRDFQARVMGDTASTGTGLYAAANWIALTENATAPADADTALTGELTAGGFARAQAVYAHTAGSSTYTLTKTFTSADATTRTLQKIGVLNLSALGTLVFQTAIPSPPALVSGDQVALTSTVNL